MILVHRAISLIPSQAFANVMSGNVTWSAPMEETYKLLDIEPSSVQGLDAYLKVRVSHLHD